MPDVGVKYAPVSVSTKVAVEPVVVVGNAKDALVAVTTGGGVMMFT